MASTFRPSDCLYNVGQHSCLEHLIITFFNELEGKNKETQLEFDTLNIAIKTIVLHQFQGKFGSIDINLFKKANKYSNYSPVIDIKVFEVNDLTRLISTTYVWYICQLFEVYSGSFVQTEN